MLNKPACILPIIKKNIKIHIKQILLNELYYIINLYLFDYYKIEYKGKSEIVIDKIEVATCEYINIYIFGIIRYEKDILYCYMIKRRSLDEIVQCISYDIALENNSTF